MIRSPRWSGHIKACVVNNEWVLRFFCYTSWKWDFLKGSDSNNTWVRFCYSLASGTIANLWEHNDKFNITLLWSSYLLFLISCLFQRDKQNIGGKFSVKEIVILPSKKKKSPILISGPSSVLRSSISISLDMSEFSIFLRCLCERM